MYVESIHPISSKFAQIVALRDFFASKNSEDLQNACERLDVKHKAHDTNWRDIEYTFNRLFIGPMSVPAPPYASVYLDPEPQMMGRTTLEVRELYHELAMESPTVGDKGILPDDHIALELDAVLALLTVEDWCRGLDGPSGVETECRMHLAWLAEHMASWVPQFTEKVRYITLNRGEEWDCDTVILNTMTVLSSTIEHLYESYSQKILVNNDIV